MRVLAHKPNRGLEQMKDLIESGKVVSVIDARYKLGQTCEAFRHFGEQTHTWKIVIVVDE
jgi:NADPH:quinone reductase-like Zn-dependent oxidoreductase